MKQFPIQRVITALALTLLTLSVALPAAAQTQSQSRLGTPADGLQVGKNYIVIEGGAPFQAVKGKIEVTEAFSYLCSHCAAFEPAMTAFAANLPSDVVVRYIPAPFRTEWQPYARAYEVARSLGVDKRTHTAVFKAVHQDRILPNDNAQPEELAAFYARYGVAPAKFLAAWNSPQVERALEADEQWLTRQETDGTPMLYVNGRYMPLGRTTGEMLRNTAALIRAVRNGTLK
ncbi:thiol:disulfide interchange protein DsbA/DsbL [Aquilutibacter rugosus]|uniref:thiol:disulfide interchange protein DsbA/DsbL n=1 Tax=Aquilutibacter rugosus TaxID=3115820 RepID=UPI002F413BB9